MHVASDRGSTPHPNPHSMPLALAILAAGRSTRFGRLKQLAPVGPAGEALLDYALHDAALSGFDRFLLVIQEALRPDFDAHLAPARAAGLDIRYGFQGLAHPGLIDAPPPERTRPWGTGHAALVAAAAMDGPFAVCNADDFYGRGAYAALARTMRGWGVGEGEAGGARGRAGDGSAAAREAAGDVALEEAPVAAATIGYPLESTLSSCGGVSRGICEVDEEGALQRLTEGLELRRAGVVVRGRGVAGRPVTVDPDVPVSTNLWGFQRRILHPLRERFAAFLASGPGLDDEFHLPEAMNELIAAGRVRCSVPPARERWLGVTFPGDHAGVAESLRTLVDSGVYPMSIWDGGPPCRESARTQTPGPVRPVADGPP